MDHPPLWAQDRVLGVAISRGLALPDFSWDTGSRHSTGSVWPSLTGWRIEVTAGPDREDQELLLERLVDSWLGGQGQTIGRASIAPGVMSWLQAEGLGG